VAAVRNEPGGCGLGPGPRWGGASGCWARRPCCASLRRDERGVGWGLEAGRQGELDRAAEGERARARASPSVCVSACMRASVALCVFTRYRMIEYVHAIIFIFNNTAFTAASPTGGLRGGHLFSRPVAPRLRLMHLAVAGAAWRSPMQRV
jgi:hypothetical protein